MASTLFIADSSVADNCCKPIWFESEDGEEVVFAISQSRTSAKAEGQDAIATSLRGKWECCVLCDGHDLHGHLVARGICEMLSTVLLDKLEPYSLDSPEAELAIIEAFDECEARVMWSNAMLQPNSFVRVIDGEWAGRVGYVSEVHDADDTFSIIIVDSDAYHRPRLPRSCLTGSRFVGGSTCVAFVRDSVANIVRVAVMGDTRALVIGAGKDTVIEKDPIWEKLGKGTFVTFPHDVFNTAELARLKAEWNGEYEIDGPYLINPLTGCEIQPTRGFGDFDMFGTGYLSIPDVSQPFPLSPGSIILVASDGIFDDNVWEDFGQLADFLTTQASTGCDLETIAQALHSETVSKSKQGGYVDDISFFMCRHVPPPQTDSRKISLSHGGIPRPPSRSVPAESGVEGLPTPASSFIYNPNNAQQQNSSHNGQSPFPRESGTLSEIAGSRRISHTNTQFSIVDDDVSHHNHVVVKTPTNRSSTIPKKRHSTADFIDPNAPRYLKEQRSELQNNQHRLEHETIRRTRGPSFMLPEGLENVMEEESDLALNLAIIGEDSVFSQNSSTSPAEVVRTAIHNKKKVSTIESNNNNNHNSRKSSSITASLLTHAVVVPRPSLNAVLQRMAVRYGHDPKQLDSLVRDLNVV